MRWMVAILLGLATPALAQAPQRVVVGQGEQVVIAPRGAPAAPARLSTVVTGGEASARPGSGRIGAAPEGYAAPGNDAGRVLSGIGNLFGEAETGRGGGSMQGAAPLLGLAAAAVLSTMYGGGQVRVSGSVSSAGVTTGATAGGASIGTTSAVTTPPSTTTVAPVRTR